MQLRKLRNSTTLIAVCKLETQKANDVIHSSLRESKPGELMV